jgi:hypothetical protein
MTMTTTNTASPISQNEDVAKRIAQITAENSPMMQQARTTGLQQANQRGLSNSSMAVGASQAEAIRAAAPIASQELAMAAKAREEQIAALTNMSTARMNAIAQTLQNDKLPADARVSALRSYNDQFSQIANYLQNLYGARLNQTAPGAAAPGYVPTGPFVPSGEPTMTAGYRPPASFALLRGLGQ